MSPNWVSKCESNLRNEKKDIAVKELASDGPGAQSSQGRNTELTRAREVMRTSGREAASPADLTQPTWLPVQL